MSAEATQLSVLPDNCISLRKGQTCFQHIEFHWQSSLTGRICLWREGDSAALKCWSQQQQGRFKLDFSSKKSTVFYLQHEQRQRIAATEVSISWVYDRRTAGRQRWRLF